MAYKSVQTGAKTQFGGEKAGLTRVGYHVVTEPAVASPPNTPASSHASMKAARRGQSVFCACRFAMIGLGDGKDIKAGGWKEVIEERLAQDFWSMVKEEWVDTREFGV